MTEQSPVLQAGLMLKTTNLVITSCYSKLRRYWLLFHAGSIFQYVATMSHYNMQSGSLHIERIICSGCRIVRKCFQPRKMTV